MTDSGLELRGVGAAYEGAPVLRSVALSLPVGSIGALLGPNGSGKTTLLRVIAGLEPPTGGELSFDGTSLNDRPAHRRGIGFVFQESALFPRRTVAENVAYGMELARWTSGEIDARLREILHRLRLDALAGRFPGSLSGGETQRVSLARTLAPRPRLVLLDEPFAAVDPELRNSLRDEFRATLREEGVTALHVTHDPEEAMAIADRLFLLRAGRIVQEGSPEEVFLRPVDAEIARFLGYQLLDVPDGLVAVHPRELEPCERSEAQWIVRVEEVRVGLGETIVTGTTERGVRIRWRRMAGSAGERGATVALRARRPVRFPSGVAGDSPVAGAPKGE